MRIISGTHRGKQLIAPKNLPVRPTTDFAKESLFNILNNYFFLDSIKVLDLFAGTGNISYEFGSRGCPEITAVDSHPACVQYIRKTAEALAYPIEVVKSDVFTYLDRSLSQYDVIFADPPYDIEPDSLERLIETVFERNLLSEEIIRYCATSQRLAPHFHIPLQSGSDEVLRLMKRRYDTALFRSRVELIRELMPHAFIGADVIVGTRGEEERYFEECYQFLEGLPFSQLHVFSYSEREGTAALSIEYAVTPRDKHKRSQRLARLSEERLQDFYRANLGRELTVIWEHGNYDGRMMGHSENYIRVAQPYDEAAIGTTTRITPQHLDESGTFVY